MSWLPVYLFIFCAALGLSQGLTPIFQFLAERFDIMDRPKGEAHKQHGKATALLGGAAMFTSWSICLAGGWFLAWSGKLPRIASGVLQNHLGGINSVGSQLGFLLLGAFLAVALGLRDDIKPMKASTKFAGQFLIAVIAVCFGKAQLSLFCPCPWLTIAISIFWFMLLMNAINFFDNMDGLAAGTAGIALMLFTVAAGFQQQYFVACLSALGAGCAMGFWFYNYTPASIFMGDGGSHLLGYLLAVSSAGTTYFNSSVAASKLSILIPLCILAVPIFDAMCVTVVRTLNGKPFWIGDHNHISHRFVRMGLSRKRAVQLVHVLCLLTGLAALPMLWGSLATAAVVTVQMVLVLTLITILQYAVIPRDLDSVVPPDQQPNPPADKSDK